jgi:hypothetical protein
MEGLNEKTIWTWNAIGKRKGAWQLEDDAPEAKKGFLLNHLINELLPARGDGQRWLNSDPVTGQAAWFDLKVQISRARPDEPKIAYPQFSALPRMNAVNPEPAKTLRYGIEWTKQSKKTAEVDK